MWFYPCYFETIISTNVKFMCAAEAKAVSSSVCEIRYFSSNESYLSSLVILDITSDVIAFRLDP